MKQACVWEVAATLATCLLFTYGALTGNPLPVLASSVTAFVAISLAMKNKV